MQLTRWKVVDVCSRASVTTITGAHSSLSTMSADHAEGTSARRANAMWLPPTMRGATRNGAVTTPAATRATSADTGEVGTFLRTFPREAISRRATGMPTDDSSAHSESAAQIPDDTGAW